MSAHDVGDGSISWVRKIPRRRKWQPTPVFLPGESHGQRSLVGYSPRGRKESDMTEQLHFHFHFIYIKVVATLCPTLCNLIGCSMPHSSVHLISQARILEWVAILTQESNPHLLHWEADSLLLNHQQTLISLHRCLQMSFLNEFVFLSSMNPESSKCLKSIR